MTDTFYRTWNYKPRHTEFGGRIYEYDFGGRNTLADIADRIVRDKNFDEQCRKNTENRKYLGGERK